MKRGGWWSRAREWLLGAASWKPASREGRRGERVAARYLARRRFRILGRNVRTAAGEADLLCVAPDRRTMVIVEVKSRVLAPGRESLAIAPEASVTREKRQRLQRTARLLARANAWEDRPWRIDVVAVEFRGRKAQTVRHHADLAWI